MDAISARALEIFHDCEPLVGSRANEEESDGGLSAWRQGRVMTAYLSMYEGTGEEKYLQSLLELIRQVLAGRGDRIGAIDEVRGKTMPAWVTTRYTKGASYAWVVHAGMFTFPMARCATILRRDRELVERYEGMIRTILADVDETIRAFQPDWRDGPAEGEGYYYCPCLKSNPPFNMQNAMGRTLVAMYLATGENRYRHKAEKLARYFKNRLKLVGEHYEWTYWNNDKPEDIAHASINIDFVIDCHRAGIVFDETDMRRFVATFDFVNRPEGFAGRVDGSSSDKPQISIGCWGRLACIEPRIRETLDRHVAVHRGSPFRVMQAAAYLVETRQPLRKEQPAVANPSP